LAFELYESLVLNIISFGEAALPGRLDVNCSMKKCNYCGRQNDDTATTCRKCGSSDFSTRAERKSEIKPHEPEPKEVPPPFFAEKEGNVFTLKCRTVREAYLVSDELEKADIVTILPEENELILEYKQKGYVELRVSANAYESVADLRSVVEFQYKKLLGGLRLPCLGKAMAMGCAVVPVPGLILFMWLLSSYRANGYDRMAKEFKFWLLLGLSAWLLVLCGLRALV